MRIMLGCFGALAVSGIHLPAALAQTDETPPVGAIEGQLIDSDGQATKTGHVAVFLCDAESGLPLLPDTRKPMTVDDGERLFMFDRYWHAITDGNGAFAFQGVPTGDYRLVAQSWSGSTEVPTAMPGQGDDPSSVIVLHGTDEVRVAAGETTHAHPRQLGSDVQRVLCDPEEPHNFIVISRGAPLGDGVLGPFAWGRKFVAGAIGMTRMETPHVTLMGLKHGEQLHIGLLNYDNNGGGGGASFTVGQHPNARVPIYAGWSNGKYEPPPRLEELTRHLEESGAELAELLDIREDLTGPFARGQLIWSRANEVLQLPGYGEATLVDVAAADAYRRMRRFRRSRLERAAARSDSTDAIQHDD